MMEVVRTPLRATATLLAVAILAAACSSGGGQPEPQPQGDGGASPTIVPTGNMSPIVASTDLYAGAPQRVQVGLVFDDGNLVSFGEVTFRFSYTGTQSNPISPTPGPEVVATYLPTPGQDRGEGTPIQATAPSTARGVYEATDITFPKAGVWTVEVTAELGDGPRVGTSAFLVDTEPRIPAPGDDAFATETLLFNDETVPLGAIDSLATSTGAVPDPRLHTWTIADAVDAGKTALVLFATPAFCMSQFCGPSVDTFAAMEEATGPEALFIHVEIWKDYERQQLNDAAIEWLYRDGDLHEPWLFLIGPDGRIADRWGPLFDPDQVLAELQRVASS